MLEVENIMELGFGFFCILKEWLFEKYDPSKEIILH